MAAPRRDRVLSRLSDRSYDVLVVGGGITGAGIALDAAARGLSVALVERGDLASGTSSRSSQLVHGGLRYLASGMVGLVRESVAERNLLRRLAPHLVRPQPFVLPQPRRVPSPLLRGSLWLYETMGAARALPRHRRLSAAEMADLAPGFTRVRAGFQFYDCRTDDARLVVTVAETAAAFGADVATRLEAVEVLLAGNRVVGATLVDRLGGGTVDVQARVVVAAVGVWADDLRQRARIGPPLLTPSKGVHLVLPGDSLPSTTAVLIASAADDGRSLFVLPWEGLAVVGTTDTAYDGPLESPSLTEDDVTYCCRAVNEAFGTGFVPGDAIGGWAGLRPLLRGEEGSEAELIMGTDTLSRRHTLIEEPDGLITITGGKLTTYRRMAAETVDRVDASLGGRGSASPTARLPLGLRGRPEDAVARVAAVCERSGVDRGMAAGLVARHGDRAATVAAFAVEHGESDRLLPHRDYLTGEIRWAVREQWAVTIRDVLERRLRVARQDAAAGGPAIERAAAVLAAELGWSEAEAARRAADYREQIAAERGAVPLASAGGQHGHGTVDGPPR